MNSKKQVYIAGKMRGVPYYNFPAFDKARDRLAGLGLTPLSPADMDRAAGFDAANWWPDVTDEERRAALFFYVDWNLLPAGFDLAAAIARDNAAIDDPETVAVYVIHEGISESAGGMAEVERAMKAGKVILFDTMTDEQILRALGYGCGVGPNSGVFQNARAFAMWEAEMKNKADPVVRTFFTDPATGGRKETKLARFDLLPPDILWELAEHYGKGSIKYGERNMEKGYPWSKTYAACHRHLNAFWRGEDVDAETGSLHLIAAAWHCFTMAWFLRHGAGTDDRPSAKKENK